MGRLGGRPKALTLNDVLREQQALEAQQNNDRGGMDTPSYQTKSLRELKRLWRSRQVERSVCK